MEAEMRRKVGLIAELDAADFVLAEMWLGIKSDHAEVAP
jgi:hypothetical protein